MSVFSENRPLGVSLYAAQILRCRFSIRILGFPHLRRLIYILYILEESRIVVLVELSRYGMLEFVNVKSVRMYDELIHDHHVE